MEKLFLTIWDLVLTPFYLLLLIFIARIQRDKWYTRKSPLRNYYLPGLYTKFAGAIFIGIVYAYYYGGGDTLNYFDHARIINSALSDSFDKWLKLIFHFSVEEAPEIYPYSSQLYWYNAPAEYTVSVITAILSLFTFNTYIPTALLFAFISYSGIWAMYRTFIQVYPKLVKPLALAFLFIPSTIVWGSGIFKDTICMFGLGWFTYSTFRTFISRDFSLKNIFLLVLSFYLIAKVKVYILLAFLPAISLWLLLTYSGKIKSKTARWVTNLLFVMITIVGFLLLSNQFAKELNKYSLDKMAETAAATRGWIGYVSDVQEGSGYDLGEFEPTLLGMLSKFPQAVVVTFFRPFPWEVNKIIVALSAIEALVFLYFTLQVIIKGGKRLKFALRDPNIIFFLVFSLIFAFAVGISSYNFGALSRYKIPCLPFYTAMLVILFYRNREQTTKINTTPKKATDVETISI